MTKTTHGTNDVPGKPEGGTKVEDTNGYKKMAAIVGGLAIIISSLANVIGNRVANPATNDAADMKKDVSNLQTDSVIRSAKIALIEERIIDTRKSIKRLETQGERHEQQLEEIHRGVNQLLNKGKTP